MPGVVVAVAAQVDELLGLAEHQVRNMTVIFYCAGEVISVLENVGPWLPIPDVLKAALKKLNIAKVTNLVDESADAP